jgi:hypothetical protein
VALAGAGAPSTGSTRLKCNRPTKEVRCPTSTPGSPKRPRRSSTP